MSKKPAKSVQNDDLRPEYDFSAAEVGKYHERYTRGTGIVRLDEDVAKEFPSSEAVNDALRRFRDIRGVVTRKSRQKPT